MCTKIRNIMKNTLITPKKIIYFIYSLILNKNISIKNIFHIFSDNTINIKKAIIFSKYNLYLYRHRLHLYIYNLYL